MLIIEHASVNPFDVLVFRDNLQENHDPDSYPLSSRLTWNNALIDIFTGDNFYSANSFSDDDEDADFLLGRRLDV